MVSNLNFSFCRPLGSDEAFAYGFYYSNLYFPLTRQSLHPCFGHFWSLAVEEHFYLIWPLTVWCLRRQSLMRICLAVAACSFLLRAGVMIFDVADFKGARHIAYFTTPCRLDGLLLGSFVALARKDQADWDGLCRWSKQLFLGSGCLVLAVVVGLRSYLVFAPTDLVASRIILEAQVRLTVGHAVASLFFMSLLILLLTAKKKNVALRILENKTLCAFGTYSYGMYVFHFMILLATVQVFPKTFSPNTGRLIIIVIVTAASFVAAWLSYHLFEKHFLRMKRFFEYRRPLPQEAESESETFDRVNKTESIPVSA
jgi:peptidoglycan/LPS O-acetylase OafA/YrhL